MSESEQLNNRQNTSNNESPEKLAPRHNPHHAASFDHIFHQEAFQGLESPQSLARGTTSPLPQSPPGSPPTASCQVLKKWTCEYCTYENFPLSLKCTMCRAVKPLVNEDIFRLQEAQQISCEGRGACSLSPNTNSNAPTKPSTPNRTAKQPSPDLQEQVQALSLGESQPDSSCNREDSPPLLAQALGKWCCEACTFENWPKATKCSMCGHTQGVPSTEPPQLITETKEPNTPKAQQRIQFGVNDLCSLNSPVHDNMEASNNRRSKRCRQSDWLWLQACLGVVDGDILPVEQYLASGGDPARQLTSSEAAFLKRNSALDAGYTLIHLAIRFEREDILSSLLSRISGGGSGLKRAPSYVAPDLASAIRRTVASSIRHKKGAPCRYMQDMPTFCLPADLEELPPPIQEQLFEELLDRDAQQQLEGDAAVINWSLELTVRLGSRLYALWNRSAGDCLLDAVLQATWGVFDRDNTLRRALADTLHDTGRAFISRWRSQEYLMAGRAGYTPDERQLEADWARCVGAAAQPGRSLQQLHVWALAHVTRRPIVVYSVGVVHSFRGEPLGMADFQGVYLPMLWEPSFCSKTPICLGYTRGHFSALVPIEPYPQSQENAAGYICRSDNEEDDVQDEIFLPLTDSDGKLLPVHFLSHDEMGLEESMLQQWMVTCTAGTGLLVARQRTRPRPLLVAQMLEEWLNHYRRIAQQTSCPFPPRLSTQVQDFSSDGETDEE